MNTAQPRVYEFSHPKWAEEPTRYRIVVDSNGAAIERFAGIDRLGGERWIWHDLLEDEINDVAGAIVIAIEKKRDQSSSHSPRSRTPVLDAAGVREVIEVWVSGGWPSWTAARGRMTPELCAEVLAEIERRRGLITATRPEPAQTLASCGVDGLDGSEPTWSYTTASGESECVPVHPRVAEAAKLSAECSEAKRQAQVARSYALPSERQAMFEAGLEGWEMASGKSSADAIREISADRNAERERADRAEATAATLRADYNEAKRRAEEARVAAAEVEPWVWSNDDTAKSVETLADRAVVRITGGHLRALIRGAVEQRVAEAIERLGESAGAADEDDEDDVGEPGADVRAAYWRGRSEAFAEATTLVRGEEDGDTGDIWRAGDEWPLRGSWIEMIHPDGSRMIIQRTDYRDFAEGVRWRYTTAPGTPAALPSAPDAKAAARPEPAQPSEPECDECGGTGGLHGQLDESAPDCDACDGAGTRPIDVPADDERRHPLPVPVEVQGS